MKARPDLCAGLVLVLLFLGSPESVVAAQSFVLRDSSGVTISENRSPVAVALRADLQLEIGSALGEDDFQFAEITDAKRHPSGQILVLDGGYGQLRVFSSKGESIARFGARGQGPGEFERAYEMWVRADAVVIWDSRLSRFTFVELPTGTMRTVGVNLAARAPIPVTVMKGGVSVMRSDPFPMPATRRPEAFFSDFYLIGSNDRGAELTTRHLFGWFGLREDGNGVYQELFSYFLQTAGAREGYWVGTTYEPEVRKYSPMGALLRIVRWTASDRAPDGHDLEKVLAKVAVRYPRHQARFESRPLADQFASHGRIMEDQAGRLWIQAYEWPGDDSPEWRLFSERGEWLGTISLDEDERLVDAGADWLLVSGKGQFDAPVVRLYRLRVSSG